MSQMSHRRIVIGDVHGHYSGLMSLLEAIAPGLNDQVYFLGDLIDRGPQSAQVVDFVRQSSYHCLLGNHEQLLLEALSSKGVSSATHQSWLYNGGYATVTSYEDAIIPNEHVDWMLSLPTHFDLGDVWLVHAGVDPKMPLSKQTAEQLCWVRDEFHSIPEPYFPDKLIVVGHTITFTLPGVTPGKLAQGQGWLDIDTGAYHPKSGWLTGLDITNNQVYQVNVYQHCTRTMPLEQAITLVEPEKIRLRKRR